MNAHFTCELLPYKPFFFQKITTGGPRQTDFFLWRLKEDNLWHQVLDGLYHAALNLRLRYDHEVDQVQEVILLFQGSVCARKCDDVFCPFGPQHLTATPNICPFLIFILSNLLEAGFFLPYWLQLIAISLLLLLIENLFWVWLHYYIQ